MNRTPFFKELSPLLFGRARANLARELKNKINLEDLHGAFGGLIDERLLEPASQKAGSRRRKLPLDVTFWAFVSQVMSPGSSCRDAVRRIEAWWSWHQWRTKHGGFQPGVMAFERTMSVESSRPFAMWTMPLLEGL